jgi:hypothetical protein
MKSVGDVKIMRPNNKTLGENTRSCQIRKINSNKSARTIGLNKHTVKSNLRLKVKEIEISESAAAAGAHSPTEDIDSRSFHLPLLAHTLIVRMREKMIGASITAPVILAVIKSRRGLID